MYLVDTSVWIDYFRERNTNAVQYFIEILDKGIPFGLTGLIYQEILQGAATTGDFNKLVEYLGTQYFYHPKDEILTYQTAAELYFLCRRKGVTIRSTVDCLIAQVAIENKLILLHSDKDYKKIKKMAPELRLCSSF